MALIIEDGTGVTDANTYVDRAGVIAYAADRGVTLADDATTDAMIYKAMDYLVMFDAQWKGEPTYSPQALAWPRQKVYIGTSLTAFPDNEIPGQLLRAQAELVLQVNAGVNLLPTTSGDTAFIKREKVDVLETEYSEAIALKLMGSLPDMPLIEALLGPLFATAGRLRTVRI